MLRSDHVVHYPKHYRLREDHKLQVSERRVCRKKIVSKKYDVNEKFRLNREGLCDLFWVQYLVYC
jgi:hypothetical protein